MIFTHVIGSNAPERLHGLVIKAIIESNNMTFEAMLPEDATPQELGYMRWFTGEILDKVKEIMPDNDLISSTEFFGEEEIIHD